jgi:hypothetical protein
VEKMRVFGRRAEAKYLIAGIRLLALSPEKLYLPQQAKF